MASTASRSRRLAFSDWSSSAVLRRSLQLILFFLFLLVPAHEGFYHFVLKGHPLFGRALLFPEHLLLLSLALVFRREMAAVVRAWRIELALVGLYAMAFWASAIVNDVNLDYALEVFVVGWFLPVLFLLLLTAARERAGFAPLRDGLPFFLMGVAVVCAVGILAYFTSFDVPRSFHEFIFDNRTDRALLGAEYGFWYGDFTLGNFNVFASYLLPALFLGYGWYGAVNKPALWMKASLGAWVVLVAANLYICYSRGAILVLNAGAALVALLSLRRREVRRGLIPAALALLVFDLLVIAPEGAVSYWRSLTRNSESNSAVQRLEQWEDVAGGRIGLPAGRGASPGAGRRMPRRVSGRWHYLFFGVGVGNYGVGRGLGFNANTHNLFLNQYVEGGALGFLSFAGLFGWVVLRGLRSLRRPRDGIELVRIGGLVGLVAIALIGVLSQYEFEYLGTMTGGVLFWTCAFFSRLGFGGKAA